MEFGKIKTVEYLAEITIGLVHTGSTFHDQDVCGTATRFHPHEHCSRAAAVGAHFLAGH